MKTNLRMIFYLFRRCRLIRMKFFMVSVILFATYLLVSYSLLQKFTRLFESSQKVKVSNNPVDLQNVVVHLDFKGMPPKLSYLKSLLPKLQELGVTSFLVEYEDMFPYDGRLVNLRGKHAYNKVELQEFLKMIVNLGFDIIPLVQTFGHMEHVLKLKEFKHLREMPLYSNVICPSKADSQILIREMLGQVIKFHHNILPLKYIHIGSDEVYHINKCRQCLQRNQTDTNIFLNHVTTTSDFIKKISPQTTTLIWEDMLRSIKMEEWVHVNNLSIEPVYWDYKDKVKLSHVALSKYHMKFDNIWIASAFKGADGKTATLPDLRKRFSNHLSWMGHIQNYKFGGEQRVYSFRGIILTGWSRYSHTAPPCELLPVAIPSLFFNLLLIKKFKNGDNNWVESEGVSDFYNKNLNDDFKGLLQCSENKDIDYFDIDTCYFDGDDLYKTLSRCDVFANYISAAVEDNYLNTKWYNKTYHDLLSLEDNLRKKLSRYYEKYFVDEYVEFKLKTSKENMLKKRDIDLIVRFI